jgi:hypothetical protein
MFIWQLLTWWYGKGWLELVRGIRHRIKRTYLGFSVDILLRTLFAPWRRIVAAESDNIIDQLRGLIDNLISRFVGLAVRLLALATAGIVLIGTIVIGGILILFWPITPVCALTLIAWGIVK